MFVSCVASVRPHVRPRTPKRELPRLLQPSPPLWRQAAAVVRWPAAATATATAGAATTASTPAATAATTYPTTAAATPAAVVTPAARLNAAVIASALTPAFPVARWRAFRLR